MPVNVKPLIADAFLKLSKEKNIDKITVKDIVDECGISRQSFYYHFQDILEVIEWSAEQAFQKLLERSMETDDAEAVFQDFITASDEASAMLRKLLNSQKREQVERLMVRSVRAYLQEHGTGRRQDFIRLLGLEPEQGTLLLRRLTDRGELVLTGRHYTLPEQEK